MAVVVGLGAAVAVAAPTIEECDTRLSERPQEQGVYYCYLQAARASGSWDEAAERLESVLAGDSDNHDARLVLAFLEDSRRSPRAEDLFRTSAEGLEAEGKYASEVHARLGLAFLLGRDRLDEAAVQLDEAMRAAESTGDPIAIARVRTGQAVQATRSQDYGKALYLLRQAKDIAVPDGPTQLQSHILSGLGGVYWYLGEFRDAIEIWMQEAELQHRIGNLFGEASPRYNIALAATNLAGLGQMDVADVERRVHEALRAALGGLNKDVEDGVRILLGDLAEGAEAIEQYELALRIAREASDAKDELRAMRLIACERWAMGQRPEAWRVLQEMTKRSEALGNAYELAQARIVRGVFLQESGTRAEAIGASVAALDAVERIRDLQPEPSIRAKVFSQWTVAYYGFAGWLFETLRDSGNAESDIDLAFRTLERMRGQELLDHLDAAGVLPVERANPLTQQRDSVLQNISELQKNLLDPTLAGPARRAALDELEHLEGEEFRLRDQLARLRPEVFSSIRDVRSSLESNQAMLVFQVFGYRDWIVPSVKRGGSWILLLTSEGTRVIRIDSEPQVLEEQVLVFSGLVERQDGSEARSANGLYDVLLKPVMAGLPEEITELILIPDGPLHSLPFSALRADPDAEPLGVRYEISYTPSATLWMTWGRGGGSAVPKPAVLALADPALPFEESGESFRGGDPLIEGLRLGPLPYARREARSLVNELGHGSRLFVGDDATEHELKTTDLGQYGILYFATHAVVDEDRPDRSAILLAPGEESEDGLLQTREIVDLDLNGQLVILSSCHSASGKVLGGEGVLGLARAFFEAGANVVVGSLWPMRDDETTALMEEFSRRIGRGDSVAAAMRGARKARYEAGGPASAWAGMVVLGAGDLVLRPPGIWDGMDAAGLAMALLLGIALAVLVFLRLSRRKSVG